MWIYIYFKRVSLWVFCLGVTCKCFDLDIDCFIIFKCDFMIECYISML